MKYTLTDLTEQEANLILQALGELPFKTSAALIQKVHQQCLAQQPKPEAKLENP